MAGRSTRLAADVLEALLNRSDSGGGKGSAENLADLRSVADRVRYPVNELGTYLKLEFAIDESLLKLRGEVNTVLRELLTEENDVEQIKKGIDALKKHIEKQQRYESLRYLVDRVHIDAVKKLLEDPSSLQEEFRRKIDTTCEAYVLCIDVRRSTDLMLKAKSPSDFSSFITGLTSKLKDVVKSNYGIYDKFTGDGVLAFYPRFFSGDDAGLRAVETANECHACFSEHYLEHRSAFQAVLKSTGLGIGIDYGLCDLRRSGTDLTLIGTPVVYACRLAGAPAGTTLVNQPAFEALMNYSDLLNFTETSLFFKGDGDMIVYDVKRNQKRWKATTPKWP